MGIDWQFPTTQQGKGNVDIDSNEQSAEREELHVLAATLDKLMRALITKNLMTREDLQEIESAVSGKLGSIPRAWSTRRFAKVVTNAEKHLRQIS
ncbi:hypothetical protein [Croceicoccus hydrothermalis]|uniref:hypothetical protein n=1 Tax=Croceicoccus hydrothermalis TaxID=2867964 RepID=UPI001EFBBF9C|nr:hypothetical protein [Croceicoccus hydrothermalis]